MTAAWGHGHPRSPPGTRHPLMASRCSTLALPENKACPPPPQQRPALLLGCGRGTTVGSHEGTNSPPGGRGNCDPKQPSSSTYPPPPPLSIDHPTTPGKGGGVGMSVYTVGGWSGGQWGRTKAKPPSNYSHTHFVLHPASPQMTMSRCALGQWPMAKHLGVPNRGPCRRADAPDGVRHAAAEPAVGPPAHPPPPPAGPPAWPGPRRPWVWQHGRAMCRGPQLLYLLEPTLHYNCSTCFRPPHPPATTRRLVSVAQSRYVNDHVMQSAPRLSIFSGGCLMDRQ